MTIYRYPLQAVLGDYTRGALGLAVTAGPMLLTSVSGAAMVVLGLLSFLFLLFGIQTWKRQHMRIGVTESDIMVLPKRLTLPWSALEEVKIHYYSTRRERDQGWMELSLRAKGRRIRLDSSMEGFDDIARRAANSALSNGLKLNQGSVHNFKALGIPLTSDGAAPGKEQ